MTFLLLIFGFILIEMPIVAFLSVVNDVHQPLPILIMALICTVIDVFIITNRITGGAGGCSVSSGRGSTRMASGARCSP